MCLSQTIAEETVSKEIYEDTYTLLRELMTETKLTVSAGLNLKFTPTEKSMAKSNTTVSGGVGLDAEYDRTQMIKEVSEYTTIKVQ